MIEILVSRTTDNVLEGFVVSERQRSYAVSNSINAVMKLIQKSQRERVKQDLRVRKTKFIERQIAIIKPFSKPFTQMAKISIGNKPRLRLANFQLGGTQYPDNANNIAIPVSGGARPSQDKNVPRGMFIGGMNLHKVGNSVRGYTSRGGVYLVRNVGIFLRVGRDTKLLYSFSKAEPFAKRLHFYIICTQVTRDNFERILKTELTMSMNKTLTKGVAALATSAVVGGLAHAIFSQLGSSVSEDLDSDEYEDD